LLLRVSVCLLPQAKDNKRHKVTKGNRGQEAGAGAINFCSYFYSISNKNKTVAFFLFLE